MTGLTIGPVSRTGLQHLPEQEGRDHPERGGDEDQREHGDQPAAVGPEQSRDPVQIGLVSGIPHLLINHK